MIEVDRADLQKIWETLMRVQAYHTSRDGMECAAQLGNHKYSPLTSAVMEAKDSLTKILGIKTYKV